MVRKNNYVVLLDETNKIIPIIIIPTPKIIPWLIFSFNK